MFDKELVINELDLVLDAIGAILRRTVEVCSVNDFLCSESRMILLDSVCMKLIAIGEGVKKIDKVTGKELLKNYTAINWKGVMAMRDIIVHHYFEVDADVVFQTLRDDLPLLRDVLIRVRDNLQS